MHKDLRKEVMANISAIIIAKNEEEMIADCIDSLSFCDEILVIDNESIDRTSDVAKRMGARVLQVSGTEFSKLRNAGLEKVKNDWVLYVDADERISKDLASSIKNQVSSIKNNKISAFKVLRKNFYFGNHEWSYIETMERLFRKKALKTWKGELHETPLFEGEIGQLKGFLPHYTHRDLSSMVKKTIAWSKVEAELRFRAGHPKMTWWRYPRVMATAFYDSYIKQQGWKVGTIGLIESIYQAFSIFITYARLWEMQQKVESGK